MPLHQVTDLRERGLDVLGGAAANGAVRLDNGGPRGEHPVGVYRPHPGLKRLQVLPSEDLFAAAVSRTGPGRRYMLAVTPWGVP